MLGRGRGLQPDGAGRSRGPLLSTEGPGFGRARGFLPPGDIPPGREVLLPPTDHVAPGRGLLLQHDEMGFGRARGLLLPAAEPKVGVSRGAVLPGLEQQRGQKHTLEAPPVSKGDTSARQREEVSHFFQIIYKIRCASILSKACVLSQVSMPACGQGSTLVSMFRGMGVTSWGRGSPAVGQFEKTPGGGGITSAPKKPINYISLSCRFSFF